MRSSEPSLARRNTFLTVFSALLAACGSSAGGGTATTGGATTGSASCAPVELTGFVDYTQELSPHAGNTVTASFVAAPSSDSIDFGCNPACAFHPLGDGGVGPDAGLDIGSVIVTDLTSKATEILTETSTDDYFASAFLWAAGDTLQVGGGSSSFPTFSVNVQAPSAIVVTGPSEAASGGTVAISQAAGLTVTWTPSSPPATFMSVGVRSLVGEIDCYPPDSAGTVTISPSLLSNIAAGTYTPGLFVGRWNTTVATVSGKNIGVQAEAYLSSGIQVGP